MRRLAVLALAVAATATGQNQTAEVTFYGSKDNCPPGGAIAYPGIHKVAGGSGTYQDPITYAGVSAVTKPGTRLYVEFLRKYFVMEDECEECEHQWKKKGMYHFDLWMGPVKPPPGPRLVACENAMTKSKAVVWIDPPSGLAVDAAPLFSNDTCIDPDAPPCHDVGTECGNECEIPAAASCASLAKMFGLTLARFEALNKGLGCGGEVKKGTSVCMGGTCGD
eukprot:TRINITY_DN9448_c1_g1_i1.p1 TRINITY_DN9448_c1_g1~~TRINITY_DN9448_c1_g1_i1.p1  ORF type:complete len:222 (+),score=65.66 TRINITY_DN9448_c1_g1_i1:82-747(+)